MKKRVFVSYNYDDKEIVHTVRGFPNQYGSDWEFLRVEEDQTKRHFDRVGRDRAIDNEINQVMSLCRYTLFAIGDNVHNSPWIAREIELALSKGHRIAVTRLPGTTGGIPVGLQRYGVVNFNPVDVITALSW